MSLMCQRRIIFFARSGVILSQASFERKGHNTEPCERWTMLKDFSLTSGH
jgi:hypothetical protein